MTTSPALLALMERVRARNTSLTSVTAEGGGSATPLTSPIADAIESIPHGITHAPNQYGIDITYNTEQQAFIDLALKGEDCVLIGAAGTGKTTCQKGAVTSLLQSSRIPTISDTQGHKYLTKDSPGIILTSFTRRAVRNLRRAMSDDMKSNCITLHKLLEYQLLYITYENELNFVLQC